MQRLEPTGWVHDDYAQVLRLVYDNCIYFVHCVQVSYFLWPLE